MASIVNGFAIEGVEGYLVDVETKTIEELQKKPGLDNWYCWM